MATDRLKLAELSERLRRLPEATQLVERAWQLNPGLPGGTAAAAPGWNGWPDGWNGAEQVLRSFISKPIPLILDPGPGLV